MDNPLEYADSVLKRIGNCKIENIQENDADSQALDKLLCICINLARIVQAGWDCSILITPDILERRKELDAAKGTIEQDLKELEAYADVDSEGGEHHTA